MTTSKADEIAAKLRMQAQELKQTWEAEEFIAARIAMIADAYKRQASNRSRAYREAMMEKVTDWLEEITTYVEKNPKALLVLMKTGK